MKETVPAYKAAELDEVLGGVLSPVEPKFAVVEKGKIMDKQACTDNLMNVMNERLPEPACMTELFE